MKTLLQKKWMFIVAFMIAGWGATAQTATAPAGTGTSGDPYQIATVDNLYWVTQNTASWVTGKYFIQTADIDASSTNTWNAGAGFSPIGISGTQFQGNYNGHGHHIDGLFIDRPSANNMGLFGDIGTTGVVDSVGATNVNFTGQGNVGGLVASLNGTVTNCYSTGTLTTSSSEYYQGAGGLVGYNNGNISNSYSACTVTGDDEIGGFVGINNVGAIIAKCYSTGSVTASADNAGGFVGIQIAMMGTAEINNCFSRGNVNGVGSVGGFVGKDQMNMGNAYIRKCYSTGSVTGTSNMGGFIGTDWSDADLSDNYFDAETDGLASTGSGTTEGFSNGATGKTTAEMKTQATFSVWDFVAIWKISSTLNDGYPAFQWAPDASAPMQLKFTTTADNRSVRLPLYGTVNCSVDWGDGSPVESFTTPGLQQHTFATAGTYTVSISGSLTQFGWYDTGNEIGWRGSGYLMEVVDFGSVGLTSLSGAFADADNLTTVPATLPPTVTDLSYCFYLNGKSSITNLNLWEVSHVTDMTGAFYEASAFNQNIISWNVSNVTTMEGMFYMANVFNQPIGSWDMSSVTSTEDMFRSAETFNQPIGAWDVSSVTTMEGMFESNPAFDQDISTWDVSNVTNMADMFDWATAFNQDISAWDVSNVTDMSWMFIGATAFDQSLADWDISAVTSMEDMFTDVTLSTANYDAILLSWEGQTVQSNVLFSGGNSKYSCGAPQTSHANLAAAPNNWTITDGGKICIEIGVKQGTTAIANYIGSYNFGGKALSTDTDVEFIIENTGDATSTLGNFTITGADSTQFSFQGVNPDSVVNGSSAAFTVRFSPTSAGAKTATVSFANQDYDENPYTFNIYGTGAMLATVEYPTGTWTEIQPVGDVDKNWRPLSVSGDGSKMLAGVYQRRLYLSSDGGTNWSETGPTPLGDKDWRYASVSADGSKMASCVWGGRIYLSSDGGTSWSETGPTPLSDKNWASISPSSNGSTMAAVNYSGRLYRSTDGGATWSESGPAPFADKNWQSVSVSADGSKMVAAAMFGRIYKSTDGGTNWSETGPSPLADNYWRTACVSSDGNTMLAGANRLYMSIDGGTNWSETGPSPLADKSWRTVSLSADGNTMIAAANTGRLYISIDKGTSWSESGPIPFDDKGWTSVVLTSDGSKMFSCAYPGRIYASSNEQLKVTNIAATTATGNGKIADLNGGGDATNRGVIYYPYTNTDKVIGDASVTNSSETGTYSTGAFTCPLTGLVANTHYNLRAHATNPIGTGYSDRCDFWTLANIPSPPFAGNATAVSMEVAVNPNGNPAATLFLIQDSVAGLYLQPDGSRTATLTWQTAAQWDTVLVTGLSTGVTYYFRVKAKNGNDTLTAWSLATGANTCSNPTSGGTIGNEQSVCLSVAPDSLVSLTAPSGYGGTLDYQWQSSTINATTGFDNITGATGAGYQPPALTDTTWFRRLVRVSCKPDWAGAAVSDVVKISCYPYHLKISGFAKYENNPKTSLNGLKILLKKGNAIVDSVFTANNGYYEFNNLTNGTFGLTIKSAHPSGNWQTWGGVNMTDYLLTYKHVTTGPQLPAFPPVVRISGDVKAPQTPPLINTLDASAIQMAAKYGWGNPAYFQIPKWVFSGVTGTIDNIPLNCADISFDLRGLCAGDVNGTWLPPNGNKMAEPGLTLENRGVIALTNDMVFPVVFGSPDAANIGALTLILNYDQPRIRITGVDMPGNDNPDLWYTAENGVLTIGWMSTDGFTVSEKHPLVYIRAVPVTGTIPEQNPIRFTLNENPLSEIADVNGNVIGGVKLSIPDGAGAETLHATSLQMAVAVYPNPVKEMLNIECQSGIDGILNLDLADMRGIVVIASKSVTVEPGFHRQQMDVSKLTPGVYFLRVSLNGETVVKKVIIG